MKKILIVFGTRPEAIKMCPLVHEFKKYPDIFQTKVCVTAQHREMLDQVLSIFEIVPDYDLNIMKEGQDLFDITSRVLLEIRPVLKDFFPDLVLIHGDTTTAFATSLAAFYEQIPVGHIEAGLRTYDLTSPWPEEANRQLSDRLCKYHFAPTQRNADCLLSEYISGEHIVVTGNTVIDALYWVIKKIDTNPSLKETLSKKIADFGYPSLHSSNHPIIQSSNHPIIQNEPKLILITGHRRENFGQGFLNICEAIKEIANKYPEVDIVYPLHLNPNVRKPVSDVLKGIKNVYLIEPLDYLPFVYLMSKSTVILTDSGGIQEEAPGLGKPVLVMRDTTERPEGLEAGTVKLVGTDKSKIVAEMSLLLDDKKAYDSMSKAYNPYGDGKSCERIVGYLRDNL
ncbi:MAG: UDP-N-acetylglucosamine 2-epimerase (non-hydrolyzing) [Candidatus Riflemargulisbacteria bacterium]